MFRDLKEYQEIQRIYEESIVKIPHEDLIIEALQEEGFTEEEFDFLVENIDEILNEQILLTEGQEDLHEKVRLVGQGLKMIGKLAGKASKTPIGQKVTKGFQAIGQRAAKDTQKVTSAVKGLAGGSGTVASKVGGSGAVASKVGGSAGASTGTGFKAFSKRADQITKSSAGQKLTNVANKVQSKVANVANKGKKVLANVKTKGKEIVKKVGSSNLGKKALNVVKKAAPLAGAVAGGVAGGIAVGNRLKTQAKDEKPDKDIKPDVKGTEQEAQKANTGSGKEIPKAKPLSDPKSARGQMQQKNIERFGKDRVQKLRDKNAAFQASKRKGSGYTRADFIKDFPNSNAAKEAAKRNRRPSVMDYESFNPAYNHETANNLAEIYKKMYDTPSEESEKKNLDEVSNLGKGYIAKKVIGTTFNKAISNPKNLNTVRAAGLTAAGTAAYAPIVGTMVAPETTQKVMQGAVDKIKEFSKPQLDVNRGGKKKEKNKDEKGIKMEAYDVVLEYLLSTQQAATIEEANYIMTEMDAKTIQDIVSQQLNEQN